MKFWQRDGDTFALHFELDQLTNPVIDMKYSPDETQLFVLYKGERGLRIFDLSGLNSAFDTLERSPLSPESATGL